MLSSVARGAFGDIRANRLRSVLSGLALLVAMGSLIGVSVVASYAQDMLVSEDERRNGRHPAIASEVVVSQVRNHEALRTALDNGVTDRGGSWYAYETATVAVATGGGTAATDVHAHLGMGDYSGVFRAETRPHQGDAAGDEVYPASVVVNTAAGDLYGGIGAELEIRLGDDVLPWKAVITGVVDDGRDMVLLYLPLSQVLHYGVLAHEVGHSLSVVAHFPGAESVQAQRAVEEALQRAGIEYHSPRDNSEILIVLADIDGMERVFTWLGTAMLAIAVLGMVNIGMASIRERIRDLSLRRALGATRLYVFGLVLSGPLLLALTAAGVTVALTVLGVRFAVPLVIDGTGGDIAASYPWGEAWKGMIAATLAGLAAGLPPAVIAVRAEPAMVLR